MDITPDTYKLHSSVIKFYDNYYVYKSETDPSYESEERVGYITKKDKIYINSGNAIRFTIKNDTLKFFNTITDSIEFYFIRFEKTNILHYFNKKYKTNVVLPNVGSLDNCVRINDVNINMFLMGYENDIMSLYYNGNKISLDTLLYRKFAIDDNSTLLRFNVLFFHKLTPYLHVRELKKELVKASLFRIKYITSDENDILYEMVFRLPPLKEDLPARKQSHHFSFEIYDNKVLYNGSDISVEQLVEKLINNIRSYPEAICEFYTDDNVSYGYYLYLLSSIRNAYYKVRNEYAEKKYGTVDYRSLDDDIIASIQEQIPMNIIELWHRQ